MNNYTKTQIQEAINYWQNRLNTMNESISEDLTIEAIEKAASTFKDSDKQRMAFVLLAIAVTSSTPLKEKTQSMLEQLESDDGLKRLFKEIGGDLYEYLGM